MKVMMTRRYSSIPNPVQVPIVGARRARNLHAGVGAFALFATLAACASAPPPPPDVPVVATPDPTLQPVFTPGAARTADTKQDQQTVQRREIVDAVWRTVRERHYDPRLGGVDWDAMRRKYEPLALAAPGDAAFYRTLNNMVGELGQSHMVVTGPGAEDDADVPTDGAVTAANAPTANRSPTPGAAGTAGASTTAAPSANSGATTPGASASNTAAPPSITPPSSAAVTPSPAPALTSPNMGIPVAVTGVGDPGLTVRAIEGRPTVTAVRPGSSAARRGIAPGFIVVRIGGRPLSTAAHSNRPLRPVEERFAMRRSAQHLLQGPAGTKVTFEYLDNDDRPGQVILERDPAAGPVRQIGHLPPLNPEARVSVIDNIGVVAFNIFLLDPLLDDIKRAVDRFRTMHVRGVILDLRGNPGGLGAMAIPVAAEFVTTPTTLGTLQFRTFSQTFTAQPSLGRTPYSGPLVILTDEGSASTSEILAGGLQESGRARIVGDTTLGAVLPSVVESLPHGAVMQVVVADFKTPKGILIEGRGVQPDRRVVETRTTFRSGRDAVLDAAVSVIKASRQGR
jgi:carboxyl-terminal processing protease